MACVFGWEKQLNFKWSLSSLGTYEKCAAKYNFRYNLGLKDPPGPAASRGIVKHKAMEDFISGASTILPTDLALYHGLLTSIKMVDGQVLPEVKLALNEKWEPCDFNAPDVWWRGVLDLLVVEPDRGTLYDWKTGKIYDDHDDQKDLYSIAALSHHQHLYEIRAIHVYLDLGKNREKTIHRDQLPPMREKFNARVAKLRSEVQFPANPSFMCKYCSFSRSNGGTCKF